MYVQTMCLHYRRRGFGHEGTRRRAFRSPYTLEFRDVTYLGVLATDWATRQFLLQGRAVDGIHSLCGFSIAPTSLWEEMFERHQREREELLRWDDGENPSRRLKRSMSSETIKEAYHSTSDAASGTSSTAETTDSESAYTSGKSRTSSISSSSSKKPSRHVRSHSPDTSTESEFSLISEPGHDSASEADSEFSFSSFPSDTDSCSGSSASWDITDDIEYASGSERGSGR